MLKVGGKEDGYLTLGRQIPYKGRTCRIRLTAKIRLPTLPRWISPGAHSAASSKFNEDQQVLALCQDC